MLGITTSIITHELRISPLVKPITKRKRPMGDEEKLAIRVDIEKLVVASFV